MKKLLLLLGVLLVLACGGIGVAVYYWMKGPADAATGFVLLLGEGKTQEAYASTAALLRQQQKEADFTAAIKQMGLLDAASAAWNNINIKNSEATISGTVTTRSGGAIPTQVQLVKESDGWRVLAITVPQAKADTANALTLPADAELRKLAAATLVEFDQAVQAKSFKAFHEKIARLWQAESTPASLQKNFQEFIDMDIKLTGIQDAPLVFSAPPAIKDKVLSLEGYSLLPPLKAAFKLDYVYEHPAWKLSGIQMNVTSPPKKE